MTTILFVCTGNTCRSPMAERLAKATTKARDIRFVSAGTAVIEGAPPPPAAVTVMSELGIGLEDHGAADVWERGPEADVIYSLSFEHRTALITAWPDRARDIDMLRLDGLSIDDPHDGSVARYREIRDAIAAAVSARAAEWENRVNV